MYLPTSAPRLQSAAGAARSGSNGAADSATEFGMAGTWPQVLHCTMTSAVWPGLETSVLFYGSTVGRTSDLGRSPSILAQIEPHGSPSRCQMRAQPPGAVSTRSHSAAEGLKLRWEHLKSDEIVPCPVRKIRARHRSTYYSHSKRMRFWYIYMLHVVSPASSLAVMTV